MHLIPPSVLASVLFAWAGISRDFKINHRNPRQLLHFASLQFLSS
jgi:hypothetical protein